MNIRKLTQLIAASFVCFACSDGEKPNAPKSDRPQKSNQPSDTNKKNSVGYQTKKAPYEMKDNHTEPKPVIPDVPPADLLEWQIKATAEAQGKIEGCKGYQALYNKNPTNISISIHKEISPSMPFWVFAIQEKSAEQNKTINYCTLIATTLEINCDSVGTSICP
jgi:hypothetical protein